MSSTVKQFYTGHAFTAVKAVDANEGKGAFCWVVRLAGVDYGILRERGKGEVDAYTVANRPIGRFRSLRQAGIAVLKAAGVAS